VAYCPGFLDEILAGEAFSALMSSVAWRQESATFKGGITVPLPRLVAWYGDAGTSYSYTGISNVANGWLPPLVTIRDVCSVVLPEGEVFNGVLLNLYRNGLDTIGYHSDNEIDLTPNSVIASVSLGATRKFQLKSKRDKTQKIELDLPHGSLILMYGHCQHDWVHGVPRDKNVQEARINLTFRSVSR
jgi:alkylated DNA repair dioxygenase AlkB